MVSHVTLAQHDINKRPETIENVGCDTKKGLCDNHGLKWRNSLRVKLLMIKLKIHNKESKNENGM